MWCCVVFRWRKKSWSHTTGQSVHVREVYEREGIVTVGSTEVHSADKVTPVDRAHCSLVFWMMKSQPEEN